MVFSKVSSLLTATHCNTLQHTATHCNTLQNAATHLHQRKLNSGGLFCKQKQKKIFSKVSSLLTAIHCNTLHHTVTHCNALQHTATHCNALQCTATHCNTLQRTATHCNTRQHTATHLHQRKSVQGGVVLSHTLIWAGYDE